MTERRRELPLLEVALLDLSRVLPHKHSRQDAYCVAERIAAFVKAFCEEEESGDVAAPESDFEREEAKQCQELYALIRPVTATLCDRDHVAAVFAGQIEPNQTEVACYRAILTQIVTHLDTWIRAQHFFETRLQRQRRQRQSIVSESEQLAELHEQRAEIEAAIRLKLYELKKMSRPSD